MSRRAQQKSSSPERRIVIVGGATEVLDDQFKDFIVEWLVPRLVEEYIHVQLKSPLCQGGRISDLSGQRSGMGSATLCEFERTSK